MENTPALVVFLVVFFGVAAITAATSLGVVAITVIRHLRTRPGRTVVQHQRSHAHA